MSVERPQWDNKSESLQILIRDTIVVLVKREERVVCNHGIVKFWILAGKIGQEKVYGLEVQALN